MFNFLFLLKLGHWIVLKSKPTSSYSKSKRFINEVLQGWNFELIDKMQAQASNIGVVDPHTTQMNQFRSYVTMLGDPNCKDVLKLKATQEISKNFEVSLHTRFFLVSAFL